jgi:hypothetical protein
MWGHRTKERTESPILAMFTSPPAQLLVQNQFLKHYLVTF